MSKLEICIAACLITLVVVALPAIMIGNSVGHDHFRWRAEHCYFETRC